VNFHESLSICTRDTLERDECFSIEVLLNYLPIVTKPLQFAANVRGMIHMNFHENLSSDRRYCGIYALLFN
jgi:hypothetical protein